MTTQLWTMTLLDPLEQFELTFMLPEVNSLTFLVGVNFLLLIALFKQATRTNIFTFFLDYTYKEISNAFMVIFKGSNQGYLYVFYYTFLCLFMNNIVGLLPWTYTMTSYLLMPFFFSFMNFVAGFYIGLERCGFSYFGSFNPPHGTPKMIHHFLIIIEVTSYFMRLVSLSVSLFANMVAGHALVKILASFAWSLIFSFGGLSLIGLLGWLAVLLIIMLEMMIAALQAYVFVFLCMIYLAEMVN